METSAALQSKIDLTARIQALELNPNKIEKMLSDINLETQEFAVNEDIAQKIISRNYPFTKDQVYEMLLEEGILVKKLGSGHGGQDRELVCVSWEKWRDVYPKKQ